MSASLFQRKRAERFAQLLDEAGGGRRHHVRSTVDDELQGLVPLTARVSDLPLQVEANQEFRDGLRAMLMATVEREGIGATAINPEPDPATTPRGLRIVRAVRRPGATRPGYTRRPRARGAIVVGLAAGTLALSGMSAASGDAIPGDALYGVKRQTERAQLALAGSDISRGQLYLEFARTRLNEAQAVKGDPAGFSAVLTDMDSETQQGARLLTTTAVDRKDSAALDALDAFATEQRRATAQLRDTASGPTQTRAEQSIQLLDDILARSKALRPLLPCGTGAVGSGDSIGPLPRTQCKQPTGHGTTPPPGNAPQRVPVDSPEASPVGKAPVPGASRAAVEAGTPTAEGESDASVAGGPGANDDRATDAGSDTRSGSGSDAGARPGPGLVGGIGGLIGGIGG